MPQHYLATCQSCGYQELCAYVPIGATVKTCPSCVVGSVVRVISFHYKPPMAEHFNESVGRPISSDRQFRDELKRKSDEASAYTGSEHNFQPVDITDKKALGVTEEGLDSTRRERRDRGLDQPTRKIIH